MNERFAPTRALTIGARTFAWTERVDPAARTLRRARDISTNAVNVIAAVAAGGATAWFGYEWLYIYGLEAGLNTAFWLQPSSAGLALSVAALAWAFFGYRLARKERAAALPPRRDDVQAEVGAYEKGRVENAARIFAPEAVTAVEEAWAFAERFQHAAVAPLHLALGAMGGDDVAVLFGRLGVPFEKVKDPIGRQLSSLEQGATDGFAPEAETVMLEAAAAAWREGFARVKPLDLFAEAVRADAFLQELLLDAGVDAPALANAVAWLRINETLRERYRRFRAEAAFKPTGNMDRAMTAVATPDLDAVTEDLTAAAVRGQLPLLVGRDREMADLLRVIEGGRQSVVLVGPSGVGKDAIVAGLAERMAEERVPKLLQDKRLVRLSIPHLLAGGSPGEAQERLLAVLADAARARNVVLMLPDVDQLADAPELLPMLTDFLGRGFTFAIATATPEAYASRVERSVLGRVLQKVAVDEPARDEAIRILESQVGFIEQQAGALFTYQAVEQAVTLSDRYIHDRFLPEKAVEVARETAVEVAKNKGKDALVTAEDVAAVVAAKTRIPLTQVASEERDTLLHLEERMHGRVIGQEEAVKAVASALRRARAELRSDARPIANFLFLGPTGVGKTELAKTVAESYFGSEDALLRFDMSEYQRPDSVARLIGVPGSGEGGLLTEAVRRTPFAIILLDELEKAHPDILNLFLQVFDDGRLTDAAGRTVDFTNAVIVATSNAGAEYVQDAVTQGTPLEDIRMRLMEQELRGIYRPEFLNRFDGIIVFRPLSQEDVENIAHLMVGQVAKRLEPRGIRFRATDEAVRELARRGFDPKFGARPLRRVVQEEVENAIANALLEGRVQRRDTIVLGEGGKIEIEAAEAL